MHARLLSVSKGIWNDMPSISDSSSDSLEFEFDKERSLSFCIPLLHIASKMDVAAVS